MTLEGLTNLMILHVHNENSLEIESINCPQPTPYAGPMSISFLRA